MNMNFHTTHGIHSEPVAGLLGTVRGTE
jgi:hypothetical protein